MKVLALLALCTLIPSPHFLLQAQTPASHGTMDLRKIESAGRISGLRDDLVWFKLDPSELNNDGNAMNYFIALNNCDSRTLMQELNSEFDAPKLIEYYRAKAPEILQQVPLWLGYSGTAYLRDYDMSRKQFPLVDATGKKQALTIGTMEFPADRRNLSHECGLALRPMGRPDPKSKFGSDYAITVPTVTYTALAVDEEAAHQYVMNRGVGRPGAGRSITILLDFDVTPQAPEIVQRSRPAGAYIVHFQGKISKITTLGGFPQKEIGTLVQ